MSKKKKIIHIILKLMWVILAVANTINIVVTIKRMYTILKKEKEINESLIIKVSNDIDTKYKVYLKDNDFIDKEYLEMNQNYIRTYIDYINVNFDYDYSSDRPADVTFNYKIVAEINVFYNKSSTATNNPEIWQDEIVLLTGKEKTNSQTVRFSKNVNLDLTKYEQLVDDFANSIKLPVTAKINVMMIVDADGIVNDDKFTSSFKNGIEIPLKQSVFDIAEQNKEETENVIYKDVEITTNKTKLIINILVFFISLIFIIISARKYISITSKSDFELEVNKYLNAYDDKIVTITSDVDRKKYSIINVLNFSELLTLSIETNAPIMYYGEEGIANFWVIKDNNLYSFVIKNKNIINTKNTKKTTMKK